MGRNGKLYEFVDVIVIVAAVEKKHSVPLLSGFVVLQRAESILIKSTNIFYIIVHYYRATRENIWYGYSN